MSELSNRFLLSTFSHLKKTGLGGTKLVYFHEQDHSRWQIDGIRLWRTSCSASCCSKVAYFATFVHVLLFSSRNGHNDDTCVF